MKKILLSCLLAMFSVIVMAEQQKVTLHIPAMECNTCKAKVEKVLNYEKGVKAVEYDMSARLVLITFDDKRTSVEKLQQALLKQIKFESNVSEAKPEKKGCSSSCTGKH